MDIKMVVGLKSLQRSLLHWQHQGQQVLLHEVLKLCHQAKLRVSSQLLPEQFPLNSQRSPPLRQRQDRREATNGTPPVSTQQRTPAAAPKAAPPPPEARPLGPNQERCDICGRGFNKDRIEKHRTICQKAATKKVKVFDATKMRTKGTEAEAFVKKGLHKKEVKVKKPNWRAKHEEFLNAVRQARMVQEHLAAGGKLSDLPPPPPSENPDYVQCPKCLRKFNETAAERHIPRCNLAPKTSSSTPTRRPAAVYGRKVTRLFDQSTSCFTRVDQSSRVTTDHLGKC
nr:zinc finger C2HC domain-containing protein 1B-like [Rhipicephalus microplus]